MDRYEAFDLTMTWEGGGRLHHVPGDPGGLTKWGFAQKYNPDVDVRNLDREGAVRLYRRLYWNRMKADQLPNDLRWDVVDFAFNAGHSRAARTLQSAINMCMEAGYGGFHAPIGIPLTVDGGIGPKTLDALSQQRADRLLRVYRAMRAEFYLSRARQGKAKFIHGWLDRVNGIQGDA